MNYQNKSVIVTGGASGFGKAFTKFYCQEGAHVSFLDIDKDAGEELCKVLKAKSLKADFYHADIRDSERVRQVINETISHQGLDILINNAGYEGSLKYLSDIEEEDFKVVMDINVMGVFYGMKYTLPHFKTQKSGCIINLGSIAGLHASPMMGAYGASKHAVIGMTKTAATEYGKFGIRVNAICPTIVEGTAMSSPNNELTQGMLDLLTKTNPMKRLGAISDVVEMAAFLSSNNASYINGQCLSIDGGQYS